MKKSQMIRIVALDQAIRARKYPNIPGISAEMEVCERTIARDVDYLKNTLGAPVCYSLTWRGFYYGRDWVLPDIHNNVAKKEDPVTWLYVEISKLNPEQFNLLAQTLAEFPPTGNNKAKSTHFNRAA